MPALSGFMLFTDRRRSNVIGKIDMLVLTMVVFVCLMFARDGHAATIAARTCSRTDVQNAVNIASRGDTVTVPAGSCTWSGTLTITKAIILQGAGKDSSIIKAGFTAPNIDSSNYTNFMLYYNPSSIASDSDVMLRITGFTFDTDYRAAGIYIRNNSLTPLRKLVIDNNYFPNSWDGNVSRWNYISTIRVSGTIYGVIHSNTISGYPKLAFSGMASNAWNYQTYTHGSADTIYFEDNEIISAGQRYGGTTSSSWWNDIGAGATAVYRYNTFHTYRTDNWCDGPNTHGNVQGPVYAGMGSEIYGNYFMHDAGTATAMNPFSQRGGKNLGFYNKVYALGSGGSRLLETEQAGKGADFESPTNHTCPSGTLYAGTKSCASDGQPQHVWRTYIWNNRVGTSGSGSIITHQGWAVTSPEQALRPNVDYFLHNQSFDGSIGVGCGKLSNRPLNCRAGVGYWATDQSCSSVPTGSFGTKPTVPISGTLYRCESTNKWTPYYAPYTYPHPLRAGEDVVSAPKAFKVVNN